MRNEYIINIENVREVDTACIAYEIRKRWPGSRIYEEGEAPFPSPSTVPLEWHMDFKNGQIIGRVQPNRKSIAIEDDRPYAELFAVWFREIIPSRHRMLVYHTSDSFDVFELQTGITLLQMIAAFTDMDYGYLISPEGKNSFKIQVADFADRLRESWDSVDIFTGEATDPYKLYWALKVEHLDLTGGIQRDQDTIFLERVHLPSVARFAVWYRRLVTAEQRLFLHRKVTKRRVELGASITEEEIMSAFKRQSS